MVELECTHVSFDEIFGSSPEEITPDRLNRFLDEILDDVHKKTNRSPDELVRIVERGRVSWMTTAEAEKVLQENESEQQESLKKSIQYAMRGDSHVLEQEIRILFMLAAGSLKKYQAQRLIPQEEIDRAEPQLIRIGRQINFQLNELRAVEQRIQEVRSKNPILERFEHGMGKLINFQKQGNTHEATKLAMELSSLKKKYVLISKGLTGDINLSYKNRMEVQRSKKSVLSWQRYLYAQREGVLHSELQASKKTIENIKFLLAKEEGEKKDYYQNELQDSVEKAGQGQKELLAVQKGQAILKKQEDETDAVIEHIQGTVEGSEGESQEKTAEKTKIKDESEEPQTQQKQRRRMISVERQEQQKNQ